MKRQRRQKKEPERLITVTRNNTKINRTITRKQRKKKKTVWIFQETNKRNLFDMAKKGTRNNINNTTMNRTAVSRKQKWEEKQLY